MTLDKTNQGYWNLDQKWRSSYTEQKYRDQNDQNIKQERTDHNKTDIRQNFSIQAIEIQVGNNSKPGSPKFIRFSLLIGEFNHFKWFTRVFLMKIDIVIDKKKELQKLSTYCKQTLVIVTTTISSDHLNSSAFYHYSIELFWVTYIYDCNKKRGSH